MLGIDKKKAERALEHIIGYMLAGAALLTGFVFVMIGIWDALHDALGHRLAAFTMALIFVIFAGLIVAIMKAHDKAIQKAEAEQQRREAALAEQNHADDNDLMKILIRDVLPAAVAGFASGRARRKGHRDPNSDT